MLWNIQKLENLKQAKIREDEKPSDPNSAFNAVINAKNDAKSGIKRETEQLSNAALKNRKKREAKKAQNSETQVSNQPQPPVNQTGNQTNAGAMTEKQKEIRKLEKKIFAINKIKEKQAKGESLEKNQIEKLSTESEILSQIEKLKISEWKF